MSKHDTSDSVREGAAFMDAGDYEKAIACFDRVIANPPANDPEVLMDALIDKASCLRRVGREQEADEVYDRLVQRFRTESRPDLRRGVVTTLLFKGARLLEGKEGERAIEVFESALELLSEADEPTLVAKTLYDRGVALASCDRFAEAIASYDELVQSDGDGTDEAVSLQVARALVAKADALKNDGRGSDAISVYNELDARFADTSAPEIEVQVAKGRHLKGMELTELGRAGEALEAYDALLSRFGESDDAAIRRRIVRALASKGDLLLLQGRSAEAVVVSEALEARGSDLGDAEPSVVVEAMHNHGLALLAEQRYEEAADRFEALAREFADSSEPWVRKMVALAMTNETEAWARLDRISEAEAVQERVVAEYGEEAVAVFAETATRFEHATDTYERVQFASARFKQGFFLMQLDRGDEADAVFADLITRFQEEDSPPFEQLVAAAHEIRHQLADPDDE